MRPLLILLIALLAGCASNGYNPLAAQTAPGSELPSLVFDVCDKSDEAGRCAKWRYGSGKIRPYDTAQPSAAAKP